MIIAVTMMRDEADVAARVVRHLLAEDVDRVLVADNCSTDGTGDLARDAGADVHLDPELGYWQADKMTRLAQQAAAFGATWIVPFDADEVWYSLDGRSIRSWLTTCPYDVVNAYGYDHIARLDDPAGHPFDAIRWRRPDHQPFPKVCFRPHPNMRIHQGNHGVDHPGRRTAGLAYRHFQYRSLEQLTRKVRQGAQAYELTTLPATEGAHWRALAGCTDAELAAAWDRLTSTSGLVHDPAPARGAVAR